MTIHLWSQSNWSRPTRLSASRWQWRWARTCWLIRAALVSSKIALWTVRWCSWVRMLLVMRWVLRRLAKLRSLRLISGKGEAAECHCGWGCQVSWQNIAGQIETKKNSNPNPKPNETQIQNLIPFIRLDFLSSDECCLPGQLTLKLVTLGLGCAIWIVDKLSNCSNNRMALCFALLLMGGMAWLRWLFSFWCCTINLLLIVQHQNFK